MTPPALTLPPFASLTLQASARRALLLPCVDPGLRGAVLSGARGSGKSLLLGSFSDFLAQARELVGEGFFPVCSSLPLACDRDRLLGGIDFGATLKGARLRHQPGLLSTGVARWIFAESLGLGERQNLALVKAWLEQTRGAALFGALTEGEDDSRTGWKHLIDAIPLLVPMDDGGSPETRQQVIAADQRRGEPGALRDAHESWAPATERLLQNVVRARARLPQVRIGEASMARIVRSSSELGVTSPRADIFALMAARAHAALRGREELEDEDFDFAVTYVLASRGQDQGASAPPQGAAEPSATANEDDGSSHSNPKPVPEAEPEPSQADAQSTSTNPSPAQGAAPPEEVLAPKPWVSADGDSAPWDALASNTTLSRGKSGARTPRATFDRGRHLRSRPGRVRGKRLAVAETIRRAAARHARHRPLEGDNLGFRVTEEDLAWRTLRSRTGHLFLIAVDASGSMAWHRMREAKGLALELLRDAYRHRDAVAVIAFRNEEAELLLPPTSAQERARRALERLPTGGGTPLASALVLLQRLTDDEKARLQRPTFALLLTDGRANVPLAGKVRDGRDIAQRELQRLCREYVVSGPTTLVVDTMPRARANKDAEDLARMLSARTVFL